MRSHIPSVTKLTSFPLPSPSLPAPYSLTTDQQPCLLPPQPGDHASSPTTSRTATQPFPTSSRQQEAVLPSNSQQTTAGTAGSGSPSSPFLILCHHHYNLYLPLHPLASLIFVSHLPFSYLISSCFQLKFYKVYEFSIYFILFSLNLIMGKS